MAGGSSDRVTRELRQVFNVGAVGTMSDAELLEWFLSDREIAGETAFEELMNRHGPMVFGVCRRVLHDRHDAEDAYQAVFLVLAKRAGSIRRQDSLASWLFGVAHRVASKARCRAARRRAVDLKAAERGGEDYLPPEAATDWEFLHHEVDRLPDRLRAPLVLCHLEGLTYGAAAQRLGLTEGTVRGRLAQGRNRLRTQLNRRGVTVPAVVLKMGALGQPLTAVPRALSSSTIQVVSGSASNGVAKVLAREVLKAMILNQLKFALGLATTLFLCLGRDG